MGATHKKWLSAIDGISDIREKYLMLYLIASVGRSGKGVDVGTILRETGLTSDDITTMRSGASFTVRGSFLFYLSYKKEKIKMKHKNIVTTARTHAREANVRTFEDFALRAAMYWYQNVRADHPGYIQYEFSEVQDKWIDCIVTLMTRHRHTESDVRLVFGYVRKEDEFWGRQIMSVAKLLKLNKDGMRYFDLMLTYAKHQEASKAKLRSDAQSEPAEKVGGLRTIEKGEPYWR